MGRFNWVLVLVLGFGLVSCTPGVDAASEVVDPSEPTVERISPVPFLTATIEPPVVSPSQTAAPATEVKMTATKTPVPATPRPSATATKTRLACWKMGGTIETGSLSKVELRLPLDYRVYLPPCYDQQPERRYPVLYLIHGQSFTDNQWDRMGADETADKLIAAGELSPFIIVMPRDRYGGQPTENKFGSTVVEVLIPYIDSHYRTLTDRPHRAVGGLSRGAGWSVHLAIYYWELFGTLGAHSPAIFHTDAQMMRPMLDKIPADQYPRIYIDIGDKDRPEITDSALWFEQLLNDRDIPHEWYMFVGYHEEAYWSAHVEDYLRWYAQDW